MSVKKAIITAKIHPVFQQTLEAHGWQITYRPAIQYQELIEVIGQFEGLVVATSIRVDKRLLDAAVHLEWVGRLGSGMELIDTVYAGQKNIACFSSPEGNSHAVAEHALGMLLNQLHHISRSNAEVRQGKWRREENRGIELSGKRVGIIGYGNTGMAFAGLLKCFGVEILVYDKYKQGFSDGCIKETDLKTLMDLADVVSFHIPLTEETRYFCDANFLAQLKRTPVIINTSRGAVVDAAALLEALEQHQIRSAALDVLENEAVDALNEGEKHLFTRLNAHPDILITPHIAGYTEESFYKLSHFLLQKLGFGPKY